MHQFRGCRYYRLFDKTPLRFSLNFHFRLPHLRGYKMEKSNMTLPAPTQPQWVFRNHVHHISAPTVSPPYTQFMYPSINHIYNKSTGKRETLDTLRALSNGTVWERALSNEWGWLASRNKYNVTSTNTIKFIHYHEVPAGRDVTYASFVCDHRPLKSEPWRVCIVVGGDCLSYADNPGSQAASLVETKILLNSVISDAHKGARFMSLDLKDFFLATLMATPEYMKVPFKYFPQDVVPTYNLQTKVSSTGYIYVKIVKRMYGLKQAAILAYQQLVANLKQDWYAPLERTDSYWGHTTLPIKFCLCVNDFGIKYISKQNLNHLITSLVKNYKISTNYSGMNYCGLTLEGHYDHSYVNISMMDYVTNALKKFQHPPPLQLQYSPHQWNRPNFGAHIQYTTTPDSFPPLDKKGGKMYNLWFALSSIMEELSITQCSSPSTKSLLIKPTQRSTFGTNVPIY